MFLHRVKMNWKRYQKLTMAILLFALARIVLETCFGEAPLGAFAVLKLALILLAATVAWAVPQDLRGIGGRLLQEAVHLQSGTA